MSWEDFRSAIRRAGVLGVATYESSGEAVLGDRLRKSLASGVSLEIQVPVQTFAGNFRLDMLLRDPNGRRIGIEVDGVEFHHPWRDLWRTVVLYAEDAIDAMYRVRGKYLDARFIVCVLADLGRQEPACFDRGARAQWEEASDSLRRERGRPDDASDNQQENTRSSTKGWLHEYRMQTAHAAGTERTDYALQPLIAFARASGLCSVEAIARGWEQRRARPRP